MSIRETLLVPISYTPKKGKADTVFGYFTFSTSIDTVRLYGVGRGAEIFPFITNYVFPDLATGDSALLSLRIQNIGTDTLSITGVKHEQAVFQLEDTVLKIPPDKKDTLRIWFRPRDFRGYEDTLFIHSNAIQKPVVPIYVVGNNNRNFYPFIISTPPDSVLEDSLWRYQIQFYDHDAEWHTFSLIEGPVERDLRLNSSTGLLTWRPGQNDIGSYDISIFVRDSRAAADTQQFQLTVVEVNDPPVFSTFPDTVTLSDSLYEYYIKAQDIDNDSIRFYLMAAPNSPSRMTLTVVSRDSAVISWIPHRSQTGMNPVIIQIHDGRGGIAQQSFNVNVTSKNFHPVFTDLADTTAVEGSVFTRQLRASDRNNDPLRYFLIQGPSGLSMDSVNGIIRWMPDEPDLGNQHLRFYVTDGFGGFDTTQFYVNAANVNDAPVVQQIPDTVIYDNSSFRYSLTATDKDSGTVLRFYSSSNIFRIDSSNGLISATIHRADTGSYTVQFRVSDGIVSTTITWRVTVVHGNEPPHVTQDTVEISFNQDDSVEVDMKPWAFDPDSDRLFWQLSLSPEVNSRIDSTRNILRLTTTPHFTGTVIIKAVVYDLVGFNDTCWVKVVVSLKNLPPAILSIHPSKDSIFIDKLGSIDFGVIAIDPEGDPLQKFWLIDGVPRGTDTVFHYAPPPGFEGVLEVKLVIFDGKNVVERKWYVAIGPVLPVNHPPVISNVGNQVALVDSLFSLKINATDIESGTNLTFSDSSPFFQIDPQTGLIQFRPTIAQVGTYPVSVIVSDGALSDTLSFTLWIRQSNNPPAILPLADTTAIEDTPFRRVIFAADPDSGDALKFYDNSPLFTIDSLNGVLQFTPVKRDTGWHRIMIWVTDGFTRDSSAFSLYVQNLNHPPAVSSFPETLAYEGQPYRYQVRAVDPDNDSLLYELILGPRGMQLAAQTGLITWTPSVNQAGEYTVEFRVSDRVGGRITQRYTLKVNHVNFPPEIINFPALQFFEDDSLIVDLTPYSSDPDAADSSMSWSVLNLKFITARMVGRIMHLTAPKDWYGKDTALIVVKDPQNASDTLRTVIKVIGINEPPRVTQDTVRILYNNKKDSMVVDMKQWAADPDSDRLFWQLSTSLVINSRIDSVRNVVRLKADPYFSGTVILRAVVWDTVGFSDTCWVNVIVSARNVPPRVAQDTVRILFNQEDSVAVDMKPWAMDPDSDRLFWQLSTSLVINTSIDSVRNTLKLTTSPHFSGTVILGAVVSDTVGFRDTCWIKIIVSARNLPPLIVSVHPVKDSVFIDNLGNVDFGVFAIDPEGDVFQKFWLVDGVPSGIDTLFRYMPPSGFEGSQEVKLALYDGKNTVERNWFVIVGPVSSVTLEYFSIAESKEQGINLKWNVNGTENTLFNVYRSRSQSGDFKLITSRPVEAADPVKGLYRWYDRDVSSGEVYYYLLESLDEKSGSALFGPLAGIVNPPSEWGLGQNYPNPFNSNTKIPFRVPYTACVKLTLYDIRGRLVKVILNEKRNPGYYSIEWDGKNSSGIPVASGVYIIQIIGDKFQTSRKLVVIK